jgi:uncharacterized protein YbaP (TraB family)
MPYAHLIRFTDMEWYVHEEFPDVFKRMVVDRNMTWMPQIEELLAGGRDAMVVVGSMHLVGEVGLVNLLREKGFTVQQQ